jgi:hypothetical protein
MVSNIMRKVIHFAVLGGLAILSSCAKKQVPEDIYGTPVFKFEGEIGSEKVDYKAGVNGLYMYTDYYKDMQDIYTLKGVLSKELCQSCSPYLSFEFKDIGSSFHNSLSSGIQFFFAIQYFIPTQWTPYKLHKPSSDFCLAQYSLARMQLIYGILMTGPPRHFNRQSIFLLQVGVKNVKLKTTVLGMSDSLIIPIDVTPLSTCRTQFSYMIDTFQKRVVVTTDNLNFANYQWDFGNGAIGEGIVDSVIYATSGVYKITLTATLGGCVSQFVQKINLSPAPFASSANFVFNTKTSQENITQQRLNTKACIITYHKDGQVYKSYKNIQQLNQSNKQIFRVTNVSSYDRNEKNLSTMALSGEVDTYLYNEVNPNDSLRIKSSALKIAVAYPD